MNCLYFFFIVFISLCYPYGGDSWSGHACSRKKLAYRTSYYCSCKRLWWCCGRSAKNTPYYTSEVVCCPGWMHNGDQNCSTAIVARSQQNTTEFLSQDITTTEAGRTNPTSTKLLTSEEATTMFTATTVEFKTNYDKFTTSPMTTSTENKQTTPIEGNDEVQDITSTEAGRTTPTSTETMTSEETTTMFTATKMDFKTNDDMTSTSPISTSRNKEPTKQPITEENGIPPQINKLDNATGDLGTSATIKCTVYGEPIPKITWMKEGTSVEITDGSQDDNSDIVASQVTRDDRMEVEGSLQISNLKSSDAGFYICKATNEAKSVQKSAYLSVQYKPNFSKVTKNVMYSRGGHSTNIKCVATGVPSADITWINKDGQTINAGDQYYSLKSVTIGEDTESTLTVSVGYSNEGIVFGVYTCKARNAIGESTKNFTLQRSEVQDITSTEAGSTTPTSTETMISEEATSMFTTTTVDFKTNDDMTSTSPTTTSRNNKQTTQPQVEGNGSTEFVCPEKFGYFPDSTDCTKFYICSWNDEYSFDCPPGTHWNQTITTCDLGDDC